MFGVNTKTASAEERLTQNYVYDGYEVEFDVTDAWDGAFNADVKIANTGDAEICDWALTFEFTHEIQNLWDATVVEHTGNAYVIKNADWNANIKPGEGVAFGMTVLCDGEISFPENFSFVMEEESVTTQSYSAEFTLYSEWETGCNGAIILSNLTDESIENWQLEFDYDREIVDIANAVIISHEQNHYVIKNTGDNADIQGKSSVHISIVAGEGAAEERPENYVMQQTVVGNSETGEEGGSEEIPDGEMDAIIAERLKGVKYKEPEAEHVQYDEATDTYYVDNQLALIVKDGVTLEQVEDYAKEIEASVVGYIVVTGDYQLELVAYLDRDDTSSYGPETITLTLRMDNDIKYKYYVRDYTNSGSSSSMALSFSGARVEVYSSQGKLEEFTVEPNQYGTRWDVFEIENGAIIQIENDNVA